MIKINSLVEVCAAAVGSAYLFVTGCLLAWFVGAGLGLAMSNHGFTGPMGFFYAAAVGFVVGPFRGSEFILNWILLLILLIVGMLNERPLVRFLMIGGVLTIALAAGYRSGTIFG